MILKKLSNILVTTYNKIKSIWPADENQEKLITLDPHRWSAI